MQQTLPAVTVVRSGFDDRFKPNLPIVELGWADKADERTWELPTGACLTAPPPRQFGIRIRRARPEIYAVQLRWDDQCFTWHALGRGQLLNSSLASLLEALGMDLWHILERSLPRRGSNPGSAA
jgi:hypothetical protein